MLCRIHCNRVTGMDSRTLNVFHKSGNKDILSVVDSIYLDLLALDVLVDEDRVLDALCEDDSHVLVNVFVVEGNDHVLTAKNVGRSQEYRVFQCVCSLERFLKCEY